MPWPAAGIDLCLHLVRRDFGAAAAASAARRCVVAPWRDGGQAQFIEHPMPVDTSHSTAATREWAMTHLDNALPVPDLARHARMTVRTFTRRFRAEVGLSPTQWIIQQRVDHTRKLLESTDLTADQVATASGFASPTLLREHLHAAVGLSPGSYRRSFAVPTSMPSAGTKSPTHQQSVAKPSAGDDQQPQTAPDTSDPCTIEARSGSHVCMGSSCS